MAELVAKVYSQALFDACSTDLNVANDVLNEYVVLKETMEKEPKFINILCSPVVTVYEKHKIIKDCFYGKVNKLIMNFMYILADKNRFNEFFNIYKEYVKLFNNAYGILEVTAVTAIELTPILAQKLKEKLEKQTNKTIVMTLVVDPSILGGILLKMDNKEIDNTVKTKLKNIQSNIKQALL